MLVKRTCLNCGKIFERKIRPAILKIGKGKFCSLNCYWVSMIGIIPKASENPLLGKKISLAKKGIPNYELRGENHPHWKGGLKFCNGYKMILSPNHPFCDKQKYCYEHRLVAEECLNRYLEPHEVIHHINEIKTDNNPTNLYLFTKRQHDRFHSKPHPLTSNII